MNKRAGWEDEATTRAGHQRQAVGADARHGQAAMPAVPLLVRRSSEQNHRTTLPGLRGKAGARPAETSVKAERRPSIRSRR